MAAGLMTGNLYTVQADLFRKLHKDGNVVDQEFLMDIFLHSIFQYYTNEFLGFDMTFNYLMFQDLELKFSVADKLKFYSLAQKMDWPMHTSSQTIRQNILPQVGVIAKAIEIFKQNKLLQSLGIAYMRQKIVTEKLYIRVSAGDEKMLSDLLKHDRYAIDLQTMIYYFMQEAYGQFITHENNAQNIQQKMKYAELMANFIPSFTKEPYYMNILTKLEELSNPMPL